VLDFDKLETYHDFASVLLGKKLLQVFICYKLIR
jgi:hypothetical protein